MELHCLPTETPTTASSCSTDPLYDNCPPFAQRGRARVREMESGVVCPAVTRLPGPCSPLHGLAPAEVPTVVSGGRGAGAWPDHSYCSWRGGLGRGGLDRGGWEAAPDPDPGVNTRRGGGGGRGGSWGDVDRAQSPSLSHSEEHRSALSLYDNLPDADTPDSLQEVFDMETSFQEQMQRAWAPEGLMEDEEASVDRSPWSSCEIILPESGSSNQDQGQDSDKKHPQESELDSGSCGFHKSPPRHHLAASCPQVTEGQAAWAPAAAWRSEQPSWSPRVPPPVPPADPSASALRSLLTGLQQQIVRQREEYEARIIR